MRMSNYPVMTTEQHKKFEHLTDAEIEKDKQKAYGDLLACESAQNLGIEKHGKYTMEYRIKENRRQINVIEQIQKYRVKGLR